MERNDDGGVSLKEVGKHLKAAKVPGGLFGVVHDKAENKFMDNLDSAKNGAVTWSEFKAALTPVHNTSCAKLL
jgi:hypothetical protein